MSFITPNDLWRFTTWPQHLIISFWSHHEHILQIRWKSDHPFSNYIGRVSLFNAIYDPCDLWPLTLWPPNLIISFLRHYKDTLQIWWKSDHPFSNYREINSAYLMPFMTPVTFDLWPPNLIISFLPHYIDTLRIWWKSDHAFLNYREIKLI